MAIASAAVRTTNTTTTNANTEIIGSAAGAFKAMECGLAQVTGTASSYGMGVPAAIGVVPTTPAAFVFEDGGNTSTPTTTSALAWSTSPTAPTVFSRRVNTPATVGAGVVWTFPRGFAVLKAKSLVTWNVATTVALDVWWIIDE